MFYQSFHDKFPTIEEEVTNWLSGLKKLYLYVNI